MGLFAVFLCIYLNMDFPLFQFGCGDILISFAINIEALFPFQCLGWLVHLKAVKQL